MNNLIKPNTIHCVDCMEGMREMPDNYVSLAIVDPPYGIGNFVPQHGKQRRLDHAEHNITWNDDIPDEEYFAELQRTSTNLIIWGANYYPFFPRHGGAIVWYKGGTNPKQSQCEIAAHTFYKKIDYVHINWQAGFYRARIENIIHECQKPVALYKWLLTNYAKEGDLILDTHVGSGSSIIACIDLGYDYIGYEIDADYYKAMQERIYQFTRQTTLEGV